MRTWHYWITEWNQQNIKFKLPHHSDDRIYTSRAVDGSTHFLEFTEQEPVRVSDLRARTIEILDAEYEKADLKDIVENSTTLNNAQKQSLLVLLEKYNKLFDGTLG